MNYKLLKVFAIVVTVLLVSCNDTVNGSEPDVAASRNGVVSQQVIKSQVRAGSAIAVQSRVLTDVRQFQPVVIELTIPAEAYRGLWLTIADSEDFDIEGDLQRWLDGGAMIRERITLTPLSAGKHYLRMTLTDNEGNRPRPVVVVLKVMSDSGELPATPQPIKNRIEFQSRPVD